MAETVLITGGLGFFGQSLTRYFSERGVPTVLLDLVSSDGMDLPPGAIAIQGDVRDASTVDRVIREHRPKLVVHAAAQLPLADPEAIRSTTVDGTRIMLEASRRLGVERFVFISSTAVYAPGNGVDRRETAPLHGTGPYGEAKIVAERLCAEARTGEMVVTVLRPKSFLGPGRMGIFQLLFDWVKEGRRIPMIGPGTNRYQLLDVDDLSLAVDVVAKAPPAEANAVFNVGAQRYGRVRDDIGALCDAAGTGGRPFPTPLKATQLALRALYLTRLTPIYPWVYETAGHDSVVPTDRLQALGWQPNYSNAESLIRTYRAHIGAESLARHARMPATGHLAPWKSGALDLVKRLF